MKKIWGEKMLTVRDLMQILPMTGNTIRAYIRDGRLKAKKFGQLYYVTETDFLTFLGRNPESELPPEYLGDPIKQTKIVFNQLYVINKDNHKSFRFLRSLIREVILREKDSPINSEKFIVEIDENWTDSHQIVVRLDNRKQILWMILYDWKLEGDRGIEPTVLWIERENMKCSRLDEELLAATKKMLTRCKAEILYLTFKPKREPTFQVKSIKGLEANIALKDNEEGEKECKS